MGLVIRHGLLSAPVAPAFVWPDATNTGCTGALTLVGRTVFSNPNVTVTNTHFNGGIVVNPSATNLTLRNCKITNGDYYGIEADNSVGLTVDRCTVIGTQNSIYNYAILVGSNATVTNCDVSQHQHGILGGAGVSIVKYNYIHDAFVHPDPRPVLLSIGSPCTASVIDHGYVAGSPISFSTTGALPTGVVGSEFDIYYVIATGLTANTFRFSTSAGGAAVNTSGTQSGVHGVFSNWEKHVGGISIKGGQTSLLVEDNFIYGQDTSCIFVKDDFASSANVTINHNKLMNQPGKPGPGYMVQAGASGPGGTVTGVRITNNFMEKGGYGHIDCDGTTDLTYLENNWSYTLNRYLNRGE